MTESNVLVVRKGRHLLAELVSETFVSNDVRFDDPAEELDGAARIVMLSGANCSGKSTYLKQVGGLRQDPARDQQPCLIAHLPFTHRLL